MRAVLLCVLLAAAALLSADAANLRAVRRMRVQADALQTPATCGSACSNCIIENAFQFFSTIRLDCSNRDSTVASFCSDAKSAGTCSGLRSGACAASCPALPPVISALEPSSGPVAGFVPITLRGSNFLPTSEARFGSSKCAVSNSTSSQIVCSLPAAANGAGSVTVTVANGNLVSNEVSFTYTAPPPTTPTATGTAAPPSTPTGTGTAAPPTPATPTGGNPPSSTGPNVPPGCYIGTARGPLGKLPTCPEPPKRYVTAVIDECPRKTRCCQSGGYVRIDNVVQPGVVPRGTLIPSCHQ